MRYPGLCFPSQGDKGSAQLAALRIKDPKFVETKAWHHRRRRRVLLSKGSAWEKPNFPPFSLRVLEAPLAERREHRRDLVTCPLGLAAKFGLPSAWMLRFAGKAELSKGFPTCSCRWWMCWSLGVPGKGCAKDVVASHSPPEKKLFPISLLPAAPLSWSLFWNLFIWERNHRGLCFPSAFT